jgi:hypothetical protein
MELLVDHSPVVERVVLPQMALLRARPPKLMDPGGEYAGQFEALTVNQHKE